MNQYLTRLLTARGYCAPLDDEGSAGGDTPVDRGDELPEEGTEQPTAEEKEESEEPDEEGEETETEKAERLAAEAEEEKKKRIRIPKARFDEAISKARAREQALLEEIERLKGSTQQQQVSANVRAIQEKLDQLQDKYEDLMVDGQKDDARKVRKEIAALQDELVEFKTSVKSDAARRAAVDELSYKAKLASMESKYPVLNPESEVFDEEKTNEVAGLMQDFIKAGVSRNAALDRAIKYVMGAAPAAKTATEREVESRRKAAEANRRQPPTTRGVGLSSEKAGFKSGELDVTRLTQNQFAKLDDDTIARLRGDYVE